MKTGLNELIHGRAYNKAGAEHWFSLNVSADEAKRYIDIYKFGFEEADAIGFAEYLKKNYTISKGKYKHRGDFYSQDKGSTAKEIYLEFLKQKYGEK